MSDSSLDAAIATLQRATELDPMSIDAWYALGRALEAKQDAAGAHAALSAVLELDPSHRAARILRADALKTLGALAEAESELRDVLREDPSSVPAWVGLVNLRPRVGDDDVEQLSRLHGSAALAPAHRIDIAFAYASALEAAGRNAEAFDVFRAANAARRATFRWNAPAVSALVDDILSAFAAKPAASENARAGHDVVFLVGMPRSGSTLAEQILASHPEVSAGGETGWLAAILQAESERRGTRFPHWVADADADDWTRLGHDYLARAASRREPGTLFTDKTTTNWQTLGAIRRMLPGARVVHCVREPLETAWSCYRQDFAGEQLWSYDIIELAAFYGDEARAMRAWCERDPKSIHTHRHETLLADPRASIGALLAHCGLAFDERCLRFDQAGREVRTASAAQVRRPLEAPVPAVQRYGGRLDPLRQALRARGVFDSGSEGKTYT
jgi:tetratricopeptide (TPR) repeat protein